MIFGLSLIGASATCNSPPIDELPPLDLVSTLSLAGGKMLFGLRRIVNLDGEELYRVLNHVNHVVHVSQLSLSCHC